MKFLTTTLALALAASLHAQVGVNNADPEQALDVGGKLKIADDTEAPSKGTLHTTLPTAISRGIPTRAGKTSIVPRPATRPACRRVCYGSST